MRRLLLAAALLVISTAAHAQTPTPWVPSATPPTDGGTGGSKLYKVMLSATTTLGASAGAYVAGLPTKRVQVIVGSCTTYTLLVESSLNGANWATEQSISNIDFGANTTGYATVITSPVRYLRTRVSAINACTITTVLLAQ